MPYIKVDTKKISNYSNEINAISTRVNRIKSEFSVIGFSLDWDIKAASGINSRIRTINSELSAERSGLNNMKSFLISSATKYNNVENKNSKSRKIKDDSPLSPMEAFKEALKLIDYIRPKVHPVPGIWTLFSPATGLLYLTSGVLYGKTPQVFDSARTPYANAYADWLGYELKDGNPGITAWVGRASAEAENEWGHAGVNAYLGKGEAEVKADFAFMETTRKKNKDGEWTTVTEFIKGEIGGGASISAVAVDGEAGVGTDMLGVEVKGEGSAGNAKIEGKGEFSVGDDGINCNLQGEAMVSAVEGEVKGTINILGIEITGKIGGHAGALGAGGKVGIEDNKFVLEGEVAAVLGVSGGIEIGFNEEGWNNFKEGVGDFVDFVTFWD